MKRLLSSQALFAIIMAFPSPDHIPPAMAAGGALVGFLCVLFAGGVYACPWIFMVSDMGALLPACGGFAEWAFLCPRAIGQTAGYCYFGSLLVSFLAHVKLFAAPAMGLVGGGGSGGVAEVMVWGFLLCFAPLMNFTGLVPMVNMAVIEAVGIVGCWTFIFCYSLSSFSMSPLASWERSGDWSLMCRELFMQYDVFTTMACLTEETVVEAAPPLLFGTAVTVVVYAMSALAVVWKLPDRALWTHSAFWFLDGVPAGVSQIASVLRSMAGCVLMLAAAGRTLYTLGQYHAVPLWDQARRTHLNADLDRAPVVATVVVTLLAIPGLAMPRELLRDICVFLSVCGQLVAVAAFLLAHSPRRRRAFALQRQAMSPGVWASWPSAQKIPRTRGWLRMSLCAVPAMLIAMFAAVASTTLAAAVVGVGFVVLMWLLTLADWALRRGRWEDAPPDLRSLYAAHDGESPLASG